MLWEFILQHPVLTSIIIFFFLIWLYAHFSCGVCKSLTRLDGKTIIITGCTSGIGEATAFELARRGARLIMACRNLEKAQAVREKIIETTKNNNVVVKLLDVSLLSSVREFAEEINRTESRLDVLIHNAGMASGGKQLTQEGLNLTWATNHFGPFLLTLLLIDLLKRTEKSRIIIVSSFLHRFGGVSLRNPNPVDEKSQDKLYMMTKFANVLFSNELARRLEGSGVTSNSLHPGAIYTQIWHKNPSWILLLLNLVKPFFKTVEQGAQTTIYLAVSEEVEGVSGKYFSDCKESTPAKRTMDVGLAKRFWEKCEEIVLLKASDPRI